MQFSEFFDAASRLAVRDSLARLLGAAEDGVIAYAYTDVVKFAGHSCPAVCARSALFGPTPRARGIRVELHDDRLDGANGVVANVARFVTGATHDTG